jgi:Holliday junction resolvase RusA-like endonuclease
MRTQTFFIEGSLPGLEEMLQTAKRPKGQHAYRALKQAAEQSVWCAIRQARLKPTVGPAHIAMLFNEPNKRRDKDNVTSGGAKIILDALRHAGILKNDTWRWVSGTSHEVVCDPQRPGVLVNIHEAEVA